VGLNFNGFCHGFTSFRYKEECLLVKVDRLTKFAYVLPIRDMWNVKRLAQLYVREMVRLHGIPANILSARDHKFQAHFW